MVLQSSMCYVALTFEGGKDVPNTDAASLHKLTQGNLHKEHRYPAGYQRDEVRN